jgi:hypothetical protein
MNVIKINKVIFLLFLKGYLIVVLDQFIAGVCL